MTDRGYGQQYFLRGVRFGAGGVTIPNRRKNPPSCFFHPKSVCYAEAVRMLVRMVCTAFMISTLSTEPPVWHVKNAKASAL